MGTVLIPYERAALSAQPLPPELVGADVLAYWALCYIYSQYNAQAITKEQGAAMKRKIVSSMDYISAQIDTKQYASDLYKYTELARSAARKNPCAETALALAEAIDGRGWEKFEKE